MKFNIGDEVKLNIKRSAGCLCGFENGSIYKVSGLDEERLRYTIETESHLRGYCDEDELELAKMKIAIHSTGISISDYPSVNAVRCAVNKMQEPVEYNAKCLGIYDKGEENYMKILEIYSRRIIKEIDNELTEKIKEINSEDNVRKILQEAENQLNVLLNRDETNPIILKCDVNCEEKTSKAIAVVQEERDEKERQLNELLMEIKAQLEITETYEQKMDILVRYGILNEQWKISDGSEEEPVKKIRKVK